MYNEINTVNRLRRSVRGRVMVATNSKMIEFLSNDLTRGMPLYSVGGIQVNHVLVFTAELDGYLSFEPDAYVKILDVGPYVTHFFDPRLVAAVRICDPFTPIIFSAGIASGFTVPNTNPAQSTHGFVLVDYAPNGADQRSLYFRFIEPQTAAAGNPLAKSIFVTGAKFLGLTAYPPYVLTTTRP